MAGQAGLIPIVACSGFAGLAYEVVWTRMLSTALGTELMAVLGVITGFFAGLALGALLLDPVIRRVRNVRRAYALLEAAIAVWAVVSIWLIPTVGHALIMLLGRTPSAGLLWLSGFVLPAVVLLPATAAMGGTLIALERLTASRRRRPRVAAGVYAANTAGATAGVLASVLVLMPQLGLSGTLLFLATVNGACAAGVLMLRRDVDAPPPTPVAAGPGVLGGTRLVVMLAATGLLGIAVEVLVIRLAAQAMQNTVFTFAFLLAAYLLGTAIGGMLWQRIGSKATPGAVAGLLAAAALATLGTAAVTRLLGPLALHAATHGWAAELALAGLLFLLPAAATGSLFGCLLQAARDRRGTVGWAVGINSLGAAAAPPLAALVFIPALGAWPALLAIAIAYLLLSPGPIRRTHAFAAVPAGVAAVLLLLPADPLTRVPPGGVLLARDEGAAATASVVEDAEGTRFLQVNGHFRMGGTNSRRSDWRQAQLPLLLHPHPRRALLLGVGTGATLAGAASMPGVDTTSVELVPEVAGLLPWFKQPGDPRLPLVVQADARRFIAADASRYDVIVADLFHPALDGSGSLYTSEQFAAVKARLAEGGLFCQWLPLYQLGLPSLRAIIRSFLDVYPDGSAWLAHFSLQTPMLALIGSRGGPAALDPVRLAAGPLQRRLEDPASQEVLRQTGLVRPIDLLGLYVAGAAGLKAWAGAGPHNTDDRPFVALDARTNTQALAAPPAVQLLTLLETLPHAKPPSNGAGSPLSERLLAYWLARDHFIATGAALPAGFRGQALIDAAAPGLLESIRISPEFDPAYGPLLSMAQAIYASDAQAGLRLLRMMDAAAPSRPDARLLLMRGAQ